nr:Fic family protein [Paenibacillus roseus]
MAEIQETPIHGNFDLKHLQEIHHYIFQDVYHFSGRIRTENIAKDTFRFAPMQFIESASKELFEKLRLERYLTELPPDVFSERAAHYMAEINVLHPFREGNGRSTREFMRQLSKQAGYELEWSRVDPRRAFQASVKSVTDTADLTQVIRDAIREADPALLKDLLKQIEGMPSIHNSVLFNQEILNRNVLSYKFSKSSRILEVNLQGIPDKIVIQMFQAPHFPQVLKEQLIDQAVLGLDSNQISLDFQK